MGRLSRSWFTLGFCLAYPLVIALDWPVFVYFPQSRHFHWGSATNDVGPAMHWYGLMASASLAGLMLALLCPEKWVAGRRRRWWWMVPMVSMLLAGALASAPAFAQGYTYSPTNADEQPGNVYFGSAKDADGRMLAGVTVVLTTTAADFVMVTDETGRFRMVLPLKYRPKDVSASCSRRGYELIRALKRPPRDESLTPVEVSCELRAGR